MPESSCFQPQDPFSFVRSGRCPAGRVDITTRNKEDTAMSYIVLEKREDAMIGILTINRPKALNALNPEVLKELDAALDGIDTNRCRCLIVKGEGEKAFVAGADIGSMSKMTKAEAKELGKLGNDVFRKLETFPVPVIAAVTGYALGGGCELALACDFRIAAENAVFGQPEVGLGITPGFGGTQRLARVIGPGKAKEMLYTAKNIKADEAFRVGLVNSVVPVGTCLEEAVKLAERIARNAPIAVRATKKAVNEGLEMKMDDAIVLEEELFSSCFESADQQNAMAAFVEKRKPDPFINQ
jgi:enoyl-CoA hydratase